MKVLWITNTIFPAPSKSLGIPEPVLGGWMFGIARRLSESRGIKLAVATTYLGKEFKSFEIESVAYYLLPTKSTTSYQKKLEPLWEKVCNEFNPDVIHIHGTEYTHGLACMRECPSFNYIVSIQGMVGLISIYYYTGINTREILKHITFRDLVRFDTLFQAKKNFRRRGKFEKEYFQRTHHVIGRTSWDYAHAKAINSILNFFPLVASYLLFKLDYPPYTCLLYTSDAADE